VFLLLGNIASAQYWFQTGVRGSNGAAFNNGASVAIQTIYQNATDGSLGFWVGEDLANGAFIQTGYEITNASGYYSTSCGSNSTKSVFIKAGVPTWFWEYFLPNTDNSSFCGGIGENGSVGLNGSFNTYAFKSIGNVWKAYFNNQVIGSINLGTSNSGPNPPSAFAEYAETDTNKLLISTVKFRNLLFYIGNTSKIVPQAFSVVGYGTGSLDSLPNPYGVKEFENYTDYFEVGSGVVTKSGDMWQIGYAVKTYSIYGNATGSGNYTAYSIVPIGVPQYVNVSKGVRESFDGWTGTGTGSYTGNSPSSYITLNSNITEVALWTRQYYLNATSQYAQVSGNGWYNVNSTIPVFLSSNVVSTQLNARNLFVKWNSSTNSSSKIEVYLDSPKALHAIWNNQYYLTVLTLYGSATGSGWYNADSTAQVSLNSVEVPINQTSKISFYNWSDGNSNISRKVKVSSPITLSAQFRKEYLIELAPQDTYGSNMTNVTYYNISGSKVATNNFFAFEGKRYNIEYLYYKGVPIATDYQFSASGPATIAFRNPVYDVEVYTKSVFGTPVNAILNVTFKNNTNRILYSGSNGTEVFDDVPYGYVSGYAEYLGIKESADVVNGYDIYLTFLTASLFAFIIGGIVFIVIVARVTAYYKKKKQTK
jgi:hypothetical protein